MRINELERRRVWIDNLKNSAKVKQLSNALVKFKLSIKHSFHALYAMESKG